ncbi:MAG: 50S ribosomal protein L35 [Berkelbacteria bacterium GW2011_GWA2_35_9]|uniref:50S ribosomal protein L35 n=1 Tax=Berkelbacteria bacterium GW2011_GWA2_35_9 TaxID=1618333 RepID=A0A0G0D135_9BACT|nr:MAG: 50S ribosomal protein L35 [Berkelbacteria bacterium GW2011_GWA2_35_9]
MKNKTNKTIAKRMRATKTGKLMRMAQSTQHLVSRKSQRQMKNAGKAVRVKKGMAKKYLKLI